MKTALDLVAAAKARIQEVPVAAAEAAIAQADVLIDVREPDEYVGGHLPESRNIPAGQISERIGELDGSNHAIFREQRGKGLLFRPQGEIAMAHLYLFVKNSHIFYLKANNHTLETVTCFTTR